MRALWIATTTLSLTAGLVAIAIYLPNRFPSIPAHEAPEALDQLAAAPAVDPLADALAEARKAYGEVKTYKALFVKRERVNGKLLPEEAMAMLTRTEPLAIYFKFLDPEKMAGQEVCFNTAKSKTQMRVRPTGLAGSLGFINIKLDDERITTTNRHTMTHAGIGALIDSIGQNYNALSKPQVKSTRYKFDTVPCRRFEIISERDDPKATCQKTFIYFQESSKLPVRLEAFDFPKQGEENGELLEQYNYLELRLNVDIPEATFIK